MKLRTIILSLTAMLFACCSSDGEVMAEEPENASNMMKMYITIGGQTQSVTLEDNSATKALVERLQKAPVTVTLNSSGGFEIWGALGFSLPTSNQQTTAQPGDVILYNGSNICLFYGTNQWSYTRLGKIDGLSASELRTFLKAGENNISVTLSLTNTTSVKGIKADGEEEDYYSMSGQKFNNPSKGIYIRNGKKSKTMKKVIVISTSLRRGSNSDMLADRFAEGAKVAGNDVEKISLVGKNIQFCKGCFGCQKLGRCVINDDVNDIMARVLKADVVCWATPIYYYEMSGQMKTLIDRMNAMYSQDYQFRDVYLLTTAAEEEEETPKRAEMGLTGWIDCYPKSRLAGTLFCGGVNDAREIEGNAKLQEAYELGKAIV